MYCIMNRLTFPPYLSAGDKVVILSPAGKVDRTFLKGAVLRLKSWGLSPVLSRHAAGSNGLYAGTIRQRLEDLQEAMDDADVRAILCSRGGYGAVHLVDKLDFTRFRESPKWLIGFSDITALHCLWHKEGFASLHAPMARHLTVEPEDDFCTQALRSILLGEAGKAEGSWAYTCESHRLNRRGTAEGLLRGGNFAVFHGLRGTPYDIPAEHTILYIEDVGERPHAIERMMYSLRLGGRLERLSGLIVGQFTEYEERKQLGRELYAALAELVKDYDYPVCFSFPVGHVTKNLPLINGAPVRLEVDKKEVRLVFEPENNLHVEP